MLENIDILIIFINMVIYAFVELRSLNKKLEMKLVYAVWYLNILYYRFINY